MGTYKLLNFKANPNEKKIIKSTYHPFLFCLCVFSHLVVIQVPFQQQRHSCTLVYHLSYHASRCFAMQIEARFKNQAWLTKRPCTKSPLERNISVKKKTKNPIAEFPIDKQSGNFLKKFNIPFLYVLILYAWNKFWCNILILSELSIIFWWDTSSIIKQLLGFSIIKS